MRGSSDGNDVVSEAVNQWSGVPASCMRSGLCADFHPAVRRVKPSVLFSVDVALEWVMFSLLTSIIASGEEEGIAPSHFSQRPTHHCLDGYS